MTLLVKKLYIYCIIPKYISENCFLDISQLLWTFQENVISKIQDVHKESNFENNTLDMVIKKIIVLSENIIIETENERLEMEKSEKEMNRLLCQLSWEWDVLQAKNKRFKG